MYVCTINYDPTITFKMFFQNPMVATYLKLDHDHFHVWYSKFRTAHIINAVNPDTSVNSKLVFALALVSCSYEASRKQIWKLSHRYWKRINGKAIACIFFLAFICGILKYVIMHFCSGRKDAEKIEQFNSFAIAIRWPTTVGNKTRKWPYETSRNEFHLSW